MRILEIDLGYQQHDRLNPKLWSDHDDLLPQVREKLLDIAIDFRKFVDIPFDVKDIILTGGQVSYFYTDFSDLDLHLVTDYSDVDCDRETEELFDTKRLLYKHRYDIRVNGIPVELYVEDLNMPAVSASYSLLKKQWIKPPTDKSVAIDEKEVKRMYRVWQTIIRHSLASNDVKTVEKVLKMLRKYRKKGLKATGEYGVANLVYKTLRNSLDLEKMAVFIDQSHDRSLSLPGQED